MKHRKVNKITRTADLLALPLLGISGLLLIVAIVAVHFGDPWSPFLYWAAIGSASFTALVQVVGIIHQVTHKSTHI
jgi:hypothetical protein